jgi:hypothetical protein
MIPSQKKKDQKSNEQPGPKIKDRERDCIALEIRSNMKVRLHSLRNEKVEKKEDSYFMLAQLLLTSKGTCIPYLP